MAVAFEDPQGHCGAPRKLQPREPKPNYAYHPTIGLQSARLGA
jgi:hypothetical protein